MTTKKQRNENTVIPKKRLGQNFLAEIGIIQKLIDAACVNGGETILEIGPGTGNLTIQLAKIGNRLLAVEKDAEMIAILKEKLGSLDNIKLIEGDALAYDETKIPAPYKVIANLPFYMASALIRKFLESANPPASLTVIVQKEVAQRICSKPPKMNLLAASVQFYAAARIVEYVSKGCFWPAPKVDCAILHLEPFRKKGERYGKEAVQKFFRIMKAGFSQPRKQLAGNLSRGLNIEKETAKELLLKNNIDPKQRPETLSIDNWISLSNGI